MIYFKDKVFKYRSMSGKNQAGTILEQAKSCGYLGSVSVVNEQGAQMYGWRYYTV